MMRRSFFLVLAVAAVVWGSGAREARAGSAQLSDLLGKGVVFTLGGESFEFDAYTPNGGAPTASNVTVTWPPTGSDGVGFTLSGNFDAASGQNLDGDLVYTVLGTDIKYVTMFGNPMAGGNGLVNVSDRVVSGTSTTGAFLGLFSISSTTPPGAGPVSTTFAPQTAITVTKNIAVSGGTQTNSFGHLSSITQTLGVIPEPTSITLLAIGAGSLLAFRRVSKWRRAA